MYRLLLAGCVLLGSLALAGIAQADPFGFAEDQYSSFGIVNAPYPYHGRHGCYPVGNGVIFGHLGVAEDFSLLRGLTGPGYQTRQSDGQWAVWQEGNWPDIALKFKAGVERDGQWQEIDLSSQWKTQSIQVLRGAALVRTVQTGDFGNLYCLTYAVPDRPLIVREYAFAPAAGAADPGWEYFLEIPLDLPTGIPFKDTPAERQARIDRIRAASHGSNRRLGAIPGVVWQGRNRLQLGSTDWSGNRPAGAAPRSPRLFGLKSDAAGAAGVAWRADFQLMAYRGHNLADETGITNFDVGGPWVSSPMVEHEAELHSVRQAAFQHWQAFSAQNQQPALPDWLGEQGIAHEQLSDLLAQVPVIIETQRDAYSGGVSPMVSYHGYWVRDTNGPLLVDLANGRFPQAMRMLRYHRACCLKRRHCAMMVPLDEDLSGLPGWRESASGGGNVPPSSTAENTAAGSRHLTACPTAGDLAGVGTQPADWAGVEVESAEVHSLIVLQHYWTWRAMHRAGGDWPAQADAFIAEAWPFIVTNLRTSWQPLYGIDFHGDETFTGGALYSTYDQPTFRDGEPQAANLQLGWASGYIPTRGWFSFDNTYLHLSANWYAAVMGQDAGLAPLLPKYEYDQVKGAEDMAGNMAGPLYHAFWQGDHWAPAVSYLTGQPWPDPFNNLSLGCFWPSATQGPCPLVLPEVLGITREFKAAQAMWYRSFMTPGSGRTTPASPFATGHAPANELMALRGDFGGDLPALRTLLAWATPDAGWCEVYHSGLQGDAAPVSIYGRVNRIRPWESGINYIALLDWLYNAPADYAAPPGLPANLSDHYVAAGYDIPANCQLLVLSTSLDWMVYEGTFPKPRTIMPSPPVKAQLPPELRELPFADATVWDAALPFDAQTLRDATLAGGTLSIPNLYVSPELLPPPGDDPAYDRETFKSRAFWLGEDMRRFARDYTAAGGTILPREWADALLGAEPAA